MWTDLDTSTVRPDRAAIHVVEFLVWWLQVGRRSYHRGVDDTIRLFAEEAVRAVGGWRQARRIVRALSTTTRILIEAKGVM